MKKNALAVIAASTLALGLSACAEGPLSVTEKMASEEQEVGAAESAQSERERPEPEPTTEEPSPVLAIGDTASYDDGLEITAEIVDTTQVSEVASTTCYVGDDVTVVELTVTNGTMVPINPWEDFSEDLRAQYTDDQNYVVAADDVFDSADYNGGWELSGGQNFATIRPGQTGSDVYGFCTEGMEPETLWLTVDPSLWAEAGDGREPIEWTNER